MLKTVKNFFNRDDCEKFYKLGKTLGQGSFATVRLATHKGDGSRWAVKIIKKAQLDAEDMEGLQSEVEILRRLNNPHIIHLREVFDCSNNLYIVMELCTGGELFDRIVEKEYYTEEEARKAVMAVANALKYCHENNVVHRDLKPENLLYSDPSPDALLKLADFGLAKLMGPNVAMHTACGTPGYVAPEILRGESYGFEVDLWSLGVITYILLCGFPPFYDDNNVALFKAIKAGRFDYPSPYWDAVSEDAKDLINHLLVVDNKKRYTCDDVLKHKFIAGSREGLSSNHLPEFRAAMRKFNARRKFKAGIMMVQAASLLERKSSIFKPGNTTSSASLAKAEGSVAPVAGEGSVTPVEGPGSPVAVAAEGGAKVEELTPALAIMNKTGGLPLEELKMTSGLPQEAGGSQQVEVRGEGEGEAAPVPAKQEDKAPVAKTEEKAPAVPAQGPAVTAPAAT